MLAAILITGCQQTGDGSSRGRSSPGSSSETTAENSSGRAFGERVEVGDTEVLVWGQEGVYGVVMAHGAAYDAASWEEQGQRIGEEGMVALAVEDTSPESLLASIDYLKEERGAQGVALVGASAGGSAALRAANQDPEVADHLILLSAAGDVSGLGEEPKLFVASEDEGLAEEVRRMAEEAPGDHNEALILPGGAHAQAIFRTEEGDLLMQSILQRLEEYGQGSV